MRNVLVIIVAIFFSFSSYGQNEINMISTISDATVYLEGARVSRKASISLKSGKNTLVFSDLTGKLDPESIQFKASDRLMIVSVSHSYDYLNQKLASDSIVGLQLDQLQLRDSILELNALKSVLLEEKAMILSNKNIGGNDGLDIEELEKAAVFFRNRLTEIELQQKKLEQEIRSLNKQQILLSKQLLELNSHNSQPGSVVKVIVDCKVEKKYDLELKYLVFNAGWEPKYDIRIDDVDEALQLNYKAKVHQDSGEDWKEVKLILSTANPQLSNVQPDMSPYYLTFNNYYQKKEKERKLYPQYGFVKGKVTDSSSGDPLIGATISTLDGKHGTVTDLNGFYQMSIPKNYDLLLFSYVGFQNIQQRIQNGIMNVSLSPGTILNEVVVTSTSSRSKMAFGSTVAGIYVDGIRVTKKPQIPLAIQKGQTSTEFVIDIPYSIPADDRDYDVTMIEYEIDAEYQYNSIPKFSEQAFLTAKISDWTQYHLQDGKIFLFLNGIYQGESCLDVKSIEDTLNVSVGIDHDIAIERELIADYSSRSFFRNSVFERKAWKIIIRNNKNSRIRLILEDQIPVSKNKDIKVEVIETSTAQLNEDDGRLTWDLELKPGEMKELVIRYEVKYPKGRSLLVE